MNPTFGFRVAPLPPSLDPNLITRLASIPVACLSDVMMRLASGGAALRPVGRARLCGTAVTVRVPPGDNLMVHKAIDMARAGDVVVVDAAGDLTNAIVGERMVAVAEAKGLAGLVIHGAVRDVALLREVALPVFALGITHRGPYKNGPGEVNHPIALAGMVVAPGDAVIGDEDGLVVLPRADALAIVEAAEKKARWEQDNPPVGADRAWIDEALRRMGCNGI